MENKIFELFEKWTRSITSHQIKGKGRKEKLKRKLVLAFHKNSPEMLVQIKWLKSFVCTTQIQPTHKMPHPWIDHVQPSFLSSSPRSIFYIPSRFILLKKGMNI